MEDWKRGDDLQPLLVHLAEHCFKAGIPEEEAVRQTLIHYYREEDERIIRSTIHNLYQECKGFGKKNSIGREQETAFLLEEFMNRRYEFRYNTVLDDLEYRQRDSIHFYFKPVDKRVRNSISICALKEGINAWDRDVDRFLNSEYVPLHNPVEEYLYDVGPLGRERPYPCIGRIGSLYESVLAGVVLSLVSEHGGALERGGSAAWKQYVTFACRSARVS